ncbi:MAG: nucleotidyltransferase family protein [Bacteroidota bacterium]|nr:nucleotidyltransferase family protein [Bacteroidota bacterium]
MEAIVLAGGLGTRLRGVVNELPKSMAGINGRPFLEYLLNYLSGQQISRIILSVGYKNEAIRDFFGDHFKSIPIEYAVEKEPLGTGGAIRYAFGQVEGDMAFVLNGDSLFRVDLNALKKFHIGNDSTFTLALHYMRDTSRYGNVRVNVEGRITGFMEKCQSEGGGLINGGIYLINKDFFLRYALPEKFSMEKDCFEKYYSEERIYGYPSEGYFLDIGIPEDYFKAQDEFRQFED